MDPARNCARCRSALTLVSRSAMKRKWQVEDRWYASRMILPKYITHPPSAAASLSHSAFNEYLHMCVSPSHLNSLEVRTYGVNKSETVPTSFLHNGAFLSCRRATCVHLIGGESLIKRWNERVYETLISGTSLWDHRKKPLSQHSDKTARLS